MNDATNLKHSSYLAKKKANVARSWKKRRMENILWLINNSSKVDNDEWLSMIQSYRRSRLFCTNLVKAMYLNASSMVFQKKCLDLLDFLLAQVLMCPGERMRQFLFSNSLLFAGILDCIVDAMQNFLTERALLTTALKILRTLMKDFVPALSDSFKRGLVVAIRAMSEFPRDIWVQKYGCDTLFRYSQNSPQRMKDVIAANGLEAVAAACDNFPDKTRNRQIHRVAKDMLNHMIVNLYGALETSHAMKELKYSLV